MDAALSEALEAVHLQETPMEFKDLPTELQHRVLYLEADAKQLGRLSCSSKACRLLAEEEAHAKVSKQQGESVLGPSETWAAALLLLELRLSSKDAARALPAHVDEDEPVGVYSANADGTGLILPSLMVTEAYETLSGTLAVFLFTDKSTLNTKGRATGSPILLRHLLTSAEFDTHSRFAAM